MSTIKRFHELMDRFRDARSKAGLTQKQLAELVGVSQASINKIETGLTASPRQLPRFAEHLGVTESWLLFGEQSEQEKAFSERLEKKIAESKGRTELRDLDGVYVTPNTVPLISWIQAGSWSEVVDDFQPGETDKYYPCPERHSVSTFALTVIGESMHPDFIPGEIIYVDPEVEAMSGSCVVVRQNGDTEATFKQLMLDGSKKYLKALNPNWPSPIIEMLPDAVICGVVIGSYRKRN